MLAAGQWAALLQAQPVLEAGHQAAEWQWAGWAPAAAEPQTPAYDGRSVQVRWVGRGWMEEEWLLLSEGRGCQLQLEHPLLLLQSQL